MCGIFGILIDDQSAFSAQAFRPALERLFELSESRGKEASGFAARTDSKIVVLKQPVSATRMIRSPLYRDQMRAVFAEQGSDGNGSAFRRPLAVVGHSRLVTNGVQTLDENNQPVIAEGFVGVHNGIVVNDANLWEAYPNLQRRHEVDSEVILSLTRFFLQETGSPREALRRTFAAIEGAASVALFAEDLGQLLMGTNTGSLYFSRSASSHALVFASERYILRRFLEETELPESFSIADIRQLEPGQALLIDLNDLSEEAFELAGAPEPAGGDPAGGEQAPAKRAEPREVIDLTARARRGVERLRRCTRCILPETFPLLTFDEEGVCSLCRNYKPVMSLGREALEAAVAPYRRDGKEPDCIVAVSGGRDSCFGLHYIKEELGLNPIAYTFDWGMVTDLARRNISRMCGKLGIEHILISADIKAKRKNIQRNLRAWLKKPELGMIPLFMAGDKQYFYYAQQLREQTGVQLVFLMGNRYEKTGFKTGFCGVDEGEGRTYDVPVTRKLKLGAYYLRQFARNPRYVNRSLTDSVHAFYSSYGMSHDFLWLFRFIPWDEEEIMQTLVEGYDWEVASDTETTWRIGDGTAAFYNYIYFTVAGFTEMDTFRSHQIRDGLIDREEALRLTLRDNQPRFDSIREYCRLIGVDADEAINVINAMPKLYD